MYYAPTPPPPHIAGRSSAAASTLRVGVPFANELHQQNAADLRFTRDNLREYVHLCRIGDAQKGLEVILRVSTSWWELLVLVVLVGITGTSSTGSILPGSPLRNSRQEITSTSSASGYRDGASGCRDDVVRVRDAASASVTLPVPLVPEEDSAPLTSPRRRQSHEVHTA